jgi:putative oxidoreductase
MTSSGVVPRSRPATVLLWIATVVAGLGIGLAGVAKFTSHMWQPLFAAWGYPAWFAGMIGALEIIGGVCLLVPRTSLYAACSLIAIMLGAFLTLSMHPGNPLGWGATPLIYMILLAGVALRRYLERPTRTTLVHVSPAASAPDRD